MEIIEGIVCKDEKDVWIEFRPGALPNFADMQFVKVIVIKDEDFLTPNDMTKELQYEGGEVSSRTPCPYCVHDPKLGTIQIGSIACSECKFFVSDDKEKKIVTCSNEGTRIS